MLANAASLNNLCKHRLLLRRYARAAGVGLVLLGLSGCCCSYGLRHEEGPEPPNRESRLRPNTRAEDVLLGGKVQLARDLYGGLDGCSDRTATLVHFDHALYGLAILLLSGEMEGLLDPL